MSTLTLSASAKVFSSSGNLRGKSILGVGEVKYQISLALVLVQMQKVP